MQGTDHYWPFRKLVPTGKNPAPRALKWATWSPLFWPKTFHQPLLSKIKLVSSFSIFSSSNFLSFFLSFLLTFFLSFLLTFFLSFLQFFHSYFSHPNTLLSHFIAKGTYETLFDLLLFVFWCVTTHHCHCQCHCFVTCMLKQLG